METIKLDAQIDENGILKLEVPTHFKSGDVEVVLVMRSKDNPEQTDKNGYPIGYFERTYGSLADDPIERPPQPPLETRDDIE